MEEIAEVVTLPPTLEDSILHMFLPKRTPEKEDSKQLKLVSSNLIAHAYSSLSNLQEELNFSQLEIMKRMMEKLKQLDSASYSHKDFVKSFTEAIAKLARHEWIPIFIRKQNCTMIISKGEGDKIKIQTFRPSQRSEDIMSTIGSLQMDFPETCDFIENESLLRSSAFASDLYTLMNEQFTMSMNTTTKGGKEFIDNRDVPEPFLISDFLVGMLVPRSDKDAKKVTKKIRDQVTIMKSNSSMVIPFRRSGMWMSIKVALRLILEDLFNAHELAKFLYKIIMLRILADMCKIYNEQRSMEKFDLDLVSQMMAKVGRRVQKLRNVAPEGFDVLRELTFNYVYKIMNEFRGKLQKLWNDITKVSLLPKDEPVKGLVQVQPLTINRSMDDLRNDLRHLIPPLNEFIREMQSPRTTITAKVNTNIHTPQMQESLNIKRYLDIRSQISAAEGGKLKNPDLLRIWLHDTEYMIKNILTWDSINPNEIFKLYKLYLPIAQKAYTDNPICFSQMILTASKMVELLDRIATEKFPLLKKYKLDIERKTYDSLLLCHAKDIRILEKMLDYFSFRDSEGHDGSLLEPKITELSFSAKFVSTYQSMIQLKQKILNDALAGKSQKFFEIERARNECRELQRQITAHGRCRCVYNYDTNRYTNRCEMCTNNWQNKLQVGRESVKVYELPLPELEHQRDAVVFELLIPNEISYLRDALAMLKYHLLRDVVINSDIEPKVCTKWLEYSRMSTYTSKKVEVISLGSQYLPTSATCNAKYNRDVLLNSNEEYIVRNGMNFWFHYEAFMEDPKPVSNFRNECTFQLNKLQCLNWMHYSSLQKYFYAEDFTQNDVIADKINCHEKLSLNEFVTFGSLRSGWRIQLRNLFNAISGRNFTMEREPVLALVLQTIWQMGPSDSAKDRESPVDFQENTSFAKEFSCMLEITIESKRANYNNCFALLIAVFVTGRIMELNEACLERCYELFQKWRKLAEDWSNEIETELRQPDQEGFNESYRKQLKKTLQIVKLCSVFTYNVYQTRDMPKALRNEEDLVHWLHTICHQHELLLETENANFSEFLKILYSIGNNIHLRLEAGIKMLRYIESSFTRFVREKWLNNFMQQNPSLLLEPNFFYSTYAQRGHAGFQILQLNCVFNQNSNITRTVTLDLYTGSFLVDGRPITELSTIVARNPQFRRVFPLNQVFELERLIEGITYRTRHEFHRKHYEFRANHAKNDLEIVELGGNHELFLVPHETFRDYVSDYFIDDYTHWLDLENMEVYFRKIAKCDDDYDFTPDYILTECNIEGEMFMLYDLHNQEYIMSIQSPGFRELTTAVSKLELSEHICVIVRDLSEVKVQLLRHNLNFILNDDKTLESYEDRGYHISTASIGTLIGMRDGLLLENKWKRFILFPHGNIHIIEGSLHQTTCINVGTLHTPTFYKYHIDPVLQRLKAQDNISAWLYLAALHAVTSSPLPDPFLGVTGTEKAMQILQSGLVWSCEPYNAESYRILRFIEALSPKRNYYGGDFYQDPSRKMEITEWVPGLPTMASYDGLAILARRLITDSCNMIELHSKLNKSENSGADEENSFSELLSIRAYFRHLAKYNDAVALDEHFLSPRGFQAAKELVLRKDEVLLKNTLLMAFVRHRYNLAQYSSDTSILPLSRGILNSFLVTDQPLSGTRSFVQRRTTTGTLVSPLPSLQECLHSDFRKNWLRIYASAIQIQDNHKLSILFCSLIYKGAPLEQVAVLHYISVLNQQCVGGGVFPQMPLVDDLSCPSKNSYNCQQIASILEKHGRPFQGEYIFSNDARSRRQEYERRQKDNINSLASNSIQIYWPCRTIESPGLLQTLEASNINASAAMNEVNRELNKWYEAWELNQFLMNVETRLTNEMLMEYGIPNPLVPQISQLHTRTHLLPILDTCVKLELGEIMQANLHNGYFWVTEASEIYRTGRFQTNHQHLQDYRNECKTKLKSLENQINTSVTNSVALKILELCELKPRLSAENLLKYLRSASNRPPSILEKCAGALGVLLTILKRLNRCLIYDVNGQIPELERELSNSGHENWSPMEYPSFLLLELDLDIMIRPVQFDVFMQMKNMPGARNGAMQLNMGEGKTSVIVPMLCTVLATEDALCRVTVIRPIFETNKKILRFTIGGLLNRRQYIFPCRRDVKFNEDLLRKILNLYKDCLNMRGVVLTLPEYRLSFRLQAYDRIQRDKDDATLGLKILDVENWLRIYTRDILDESDELLNVKYQLIYTIGEQLKLEGGNAGETRWKLCQKILDYIQDIGSDILENFPDDVEFDAESHQLIPYEFAFIRLLTNDENSPCINHVVTTIAILFLRESVLPNLDNNEDRDHLMNLTRTFLVDNKIDEETHTRVLSAFETKKPQLFQKILLVSGYLRRGILSLALTKRWRVEYGVDVSPKGFRKMAVPFRAKDIAAEKTEFGHPDLAIMLTHLSYYYSGLNHDEMIETFETLEGKLEPGGIYTLWISSIPPPLDIPRSYDQVNLRNDQQRYTIFNKLRKHKQVIDFWLSNVVFPRESKQFPQKLVMTAWDLVYERQRHPVTGFSGTNDSIVLLPLNISQQDLPQLQETNRRMEEILMQEENSGHMGLPVGVTCSEILELMVQDDLRYLIDSGALMLDCNNEQVADLWLEINNEILAVVYFDYDNKLMAKTRESIAPFELSPYQDLQNCAVFLDDHHTRGTDLRFPLGTKACVTIGSRMCRDKLMQACMRLRKLGYGHSVAFYLSREANSKALASFGLQPNDEITTEAILHWVGENTRKFNRDGLLYWAISGRNYAQKLAAEDIFHHPNFVEPPRLENLQCLQDKAKHLSNHCVDDEVTSLKDFYGRYTLMEPFPNLIRQWHTSVQAKLTKASPDEDLPPDVIAHLDQIIERIRVRCEENVPDNMVPCRRRQGNEKYSSAPPTTLEEEQEKELIEEQYNLAKPPEAISVEPVVHENVKNVILGKRSLGPMEGIKRVSNIFENTKFKDEVQFEHWNAEVYATEDFISVIQPSSLTSFNTNWFLKPIEYVAINRRKNNEETLKILILSQFEVNNLLPYFNLKKGIPSYELRHFSSRRFQEQDILVNKPNLRLPITNDNFIQVPHGSMEMAALFAASGNLYFNPEFPEEQPSFASFLSLVEQEGHEFLQFQGNQGRFIADPSELIRKILSCRHSSVTEVAHVVRILDGRRFIKL